MKRATPADSPLGGATIVLGCEPLGGTDCGRVDLSEAIAAISHGLELGINAFDTADVYGLGQSEIVLSNALGSRRHDAVIISKFGVNWENQEPGGRARTYRDSSPQHVRKALEGSLRRLRVDRIPVYVVHWPDPKTPITSTMEALMECREKGLIGNIGVSNFSAAQLTEAAAVAVPDVAEAQLSLLDRNTLREFAPSCVRLGVSLLAYGTLAQGLLTGKYETGIRFEADDRRSRLPHFAPARMEQSAPLLEAIAERARQLNCTMAQVAIRWVLDQPGVTAAIVAAKSPSQVQEAVESAKFRVDLSDL